MVLQDNKILMIPSFYPKELDYPRGNFFQEQALLLKKYGANIDVIFCEDRSITTLNIERIKIAHFQIEVKNEYGLRVMRKKSWNIVPTRFDLGKRLLIKKFISLAEKYIKEFGKPKLVHAQCAFPAGFIALHLNRKYNIPYIITEHSYHISFGVKGNSVPFYREIFNSAEETIVVSNSLKNLINKKYTISEHEIKVIPNFIDTEFFKGHNNSEIKKNIIFTVSYHTDNKNLDLTIYAFEKLLIQFPDWILIIGGEGPKTNYLRQLVSKLKLEKNILFIGFLDRSGIKEWMNKSKLFVLSSNFETFGVVLIEAMAMGIPVISTKCGGPEDIVSPEVGILVENEVTSLKNAMVSILENLNDYNSKSIRNIMKDKFSMEVVANKYIEIYNKFILG